MPSPGSVVAFALPSPGSVVAFALQSFALIAVPGPSVMFIVSRGVALGRLSARP